MAQGNLQGDVALITGASSGIGEASAQELARDGATIAVAARRETKLRKLARSLENEFGCSTLVVPTDVTDESQVNNMIEETVDSFGSLDIVVNNAGIGHSGRVDEMSTEEFLTVMAVNTNGMFFTTRAALPHLRQSGGTLVFIGSIAGKYPRSFYPVYAASKWWARGFALSLAAQVGGENVAVSTINPTGVRTEFGSEFGTTNKERFDEGEYLEPEAIGRAVAYVSKQEAPATVTELDLFRQNEFTEY